MDEKSSYREFTGERTHNGGGITQQVADTTEAVMEGARELGDEAIDRVDEYLRPIGLSLREKPMMTLAAVTGVAVALGALWTIRRHQNQTQLSQLSNQVGSLWDQISRSQSRWR